jgi:adenosylhomocysteine nucleosidase
MLMSLVNALPDPLIVMALALESQGVFEREAVPVLYTGVGKVNAAHALTRRLQEYRRAHQALPLVVNFGTAGSQLFPGGSLVACDEFVQRDMDVTGLGFPHGVTPYEDTPPVLQFAEHFLELPHARCGSGDSFVTAPATLECGVLDMEAYALAKVCWLEGARFACVKYVTDGADQNAGQHWQDNLHRAAAEFLALYRALGSSSP